MFCLKSRKLRKFTGEQFQKSQQRKCVVNYAGQNPGDLDDKAFQDCPKITLVYLSAR